MIIGSKKIFHEKLSSTNSQAAWLLRKGKVQDGTVIYSDFQTAGRGQPGNSWESEYGKNLLFSIILFPVSLKAERQFSLSKVVSLGIKDFLERQNLKDVSIKWPNDIYVRNDKIAGILIENAIIRSEIEHSIIGIGININQVKFSGSVSNGTSLKIITGRDIKREDCLDGLLRAIDSRYRHRPFDPKSRINNDYITSIYRVAQWTDFRDSRGIFEGRIIAVTDSGRIQIEDRKSRIYEYGHKEVDFL